MIRDSESIVVDSFRQLIAEDAQASIPVCASVSLNFWAQAKRWVKQLDGAPRPFIIALAGGSGAGKSLVRDALVTALSQVAPVAAFTQDHYYRDFAADYPAVSLEDFYNTIDFDDPAHLELDALATDLRRLQQAAIGTSIALPRLVYGTPTAKPTRIDEGLILPATPFIVTEGIHAFHTEALRDLYDLKIFVDVDEATRRARWLARNQRDNRGVTDNMWDTTVACMRTHILPHRAHADVVLDNRASREQIRTFIDRVVRTVQQSATSVA